jgi:hypothetical protein
MDDPVQRLREQLNDSYSDIGAPERQRELFE